MSKGGVGMSIKIIVRVIAIWGKLFFKIKVSIGVLVSRKKVFSESSHHIDTYIDVVL